MSRLNYTDEDYKALSKSFYNFRQANQTFSELDLISLLRSQNFLHQPIFIRMFYKRGLIKKLHNNQLIFLSDTIHYQLLHTMVEDYRSIIRHNNDKYRSSKSISPIDKAIALLKENGYRIFKEL